MTIPENHPRVTFGCIYCHRVDVPAGHSCQAMKEARAWQSNTAIEEVMRLQDEVERLKELLRKSCFHFAVLYAAHRVVTAKEMAAFLRKEVPLP